MCRVLFGPRLGCERARLTPVRIVKRQLRVLNVNSRVRPGLNSASLSG